MDRRHSACLFLALFSCCNLASQAAAGDDEIDFFEAKIRPVLVQHCYQCHSRGSGESEGGLRLDSRQSIRRGGESGPAVVPGDISESLLVIAISHSLDGTEMPPAKPRLAESVIADFRRWIELGAPDPRDESKLGPVPAARPKAEDHWAYQPVSNPQPPDIDDPAWPSRPLDRFVLAKLRSKNLSPSTDAEPRVLIRRMHFDLIGLPPSPVQVEWFLRQVQASGLDVAMEVAVDQLLQSPRFGERWGRHWLDVARFAESSGKETNVTYPHAWRYRNYVIDAINEDRAYDRFVTEQIAGDLLPARDDLHREELMIATGYLAIGPKGLNEMNGLQFLADVIDEQIDSVTQSIMASTVACARCHDHKYDPFSMRDYYALAGIFASTKTHYGTSVAPGNQNGGDLLVLPRTPGQVIPNRSLSPRQNQSLRDERLALQNESRERKAAARKAVESGKDPNEFYSLRDALRILWRTGAIEGKLKTVDQEGRALPLAMGVSDRPSATDVPILERGEIGRPGTLVARGMPAAITLSSHHAIDPSASGRLELARWLTDPEHPLTARVMVNRIWQHLMGSGIVRSVDNFGTEGEVPSHPQLLDYLALRFIQTGWSTKAMIREIMLSRTYRQSSSFDESSFLIDPENRLLWRHDKRRLDAEAIRDAMLFASGRLDVGRPASSLVANVGDKPVSLFSLDRRVPKDLDGALYRSVYLPILRDRLPDVLDLFDFAEPSMVTGRRQTTNVPLQSLYLMNSEFVRSQAAGLADRLDRLSKTKDQIDEAFTVCFGRKATDQERAIGLPFLESNSLASYCQALFVTAEFRNVD